MSDHHFVSQQMFESLLSELAVYAQQSCVDRRASIHAPRIQAPAIAAASARTDGKSSLDESQHDDNNNSKHGGSAMMITTAASSSSLHNEEELKTVSSEMAAAKMERMGYAVGYRLTERLAQTKTWNSLLSQDAAAQTAAQQLEAVKFLCKEVWVQIFGKQIDKLQTNHRGVFVLKDLNLSWLSYFPSGTEEARTKAIQLLAFPCGLVRGCLADLGIPSVVSCDFLADGQNMAACSFNIKVK